MPTFFSDHQKYFSLKPLSDLPISGFRPGQLGALHSVLAHFSINEDPAVICLPTGYGKTAVMMALPFVLNAKRTLVIEPSDALRKQTTGHFKALSTLRRLHVLEQECPNPMVVSQMGRPVTEDDWERRSSTRGSGSEITGLTHGGPLRGRIARSTKLRMGREAAAPPRFGAGVHPLKPRHRGLRHEFVLSSRRGGPPRPPRLWSSHGAGRERPSGCFGPGDQ